ncbi:MAG: translation initiation factor IF-2 [Candidatus Nanosynbacter sp.]|jgi:translation initiation factor IF-2|nr:translation initiation factor IF-2 [Candidatus Saccharibacteria bacterium]MBB1549399.1 translation initiation factor IF-2 [Candidatus Saccharibacteria bacterium]MBF1037240.1 translation initiation factor IF-2 [Candidatus Nanosynbacter sp.]
MAETQEKIIQIAGSITVDELAEALGLSVTALIGELFKQGIMATINQRLDFDTASLIIDELEIKNVKLERKNTATKTSNFHRELSEKAVLRPPVVAVMGHVDHGKTTLLDSLLHKKTVEGEAGGITQHISAYQLKHDDRLITFLDTPGHEAFAAIRQHGAMLTDIVVIVVAADDGVKPQTVEAIKFAQSANAKIIVAINKIDREGADIPRTMADLAQHGLQPEEWGGDITMVPISAKRGDNLEKLLDMILLTADLEELKADVEIPAEGLVIESHMEVGKGSVVNLLVTGGELKTGKFVVAGSAYGKIRTMMDFRGKPKGKATPSTPVTVTGFKELPNFGDRFIEVKDEKTARKQALLNAQVEASETASANVTSTDLLRMMNTADNSKVFNVIIKGDVLGSVTSVIDSLKMIDTKGEISLNIVSSGVGDVTENDVYMAEGDNTVVYGFNVNVPTNIVKLAARDGVEIRNYRVIYELLDDAKASMENLLDDEVVEEETGEMKIKGVFRTERTAIIAGGEVLTGRVGAGMLGRVYRNKELIGEVSVDSVQKEKMQVTELVAGETGGIAFNLEKKLVIELNDRVKFFTRELRKKKL